MIRILIALLVVIVSALTTFAQSPALAQAAKTTKKAAPANDIYSGTVTESDATSMTVLRKAPGRADEARKFLIDKETKVEGRVRANARVTVRFKADSTGAFHALRVIVRADTKATVSAGRSERNATSE